MNNQAADFLVLDDHQLIAVNGGLPAMAERMLENIHNRADHGEGLGAAIGTVGGAIGGGVVG